MSMEIQEPPAGQPLVTMQVGQGPDRVTVVVGPEPPHRVGPRKSIALIALPVLLLLYVYLAARGVYLTYEHKKPEPAVVVVPEGWEPDGPALFAQHCARCHGPTGNGGGVMSFVLNPPARKFGWEKFALATTTNGVPTDDDLMYVIRHGISGTSMPAHEQLTDAECHAVAAHVRRLAHAGLYAMLFELAAKDEDPVPLEISAMTAKRLTPGEPLPIPVLREPTPDSVARGFKVFQDNCKTCHGPEGKGDGEKVTDMKNDNGWPTKPRDLARGIFKGGSEKERVYARIALGLPGTPMPGTAATLTPDQLADLTNFVLSLSRRDAAH
ncbi:MAG TPA: c-type cytochrome [Gemmataceae bacterium]|nr:c-type cytochrome [Gemmataceae bacterium]